MFNPWFIFLLFAFIATVGTFWFLKEHRSLRAAIVGVFVSLLFFTGLAAYVVWVVRWSMAE